MATNLDFIKKLYNGKNAYSDHYSASQLSLMHISSNVEDIVLDFLRKGKTVFLTGNPGDGKTFIINEHKEDIEKINTYVETDLNNIVDYQVIASRIVDRVKDKLPTVIACNEYPFLQLMREIKEIDESIYSEILRVKNNAITYLGEAEKDSEIRSIAVIDLNNRNLLDKDHSAVTEIVSKMCELLNAEKDVSKRDLNYNVMALSNVETQKQLLELFNYVSVSHDHFAIRDILGTFSFMITACEREEYEGVRYYDALFQGENELLFELRKFDPINLSNPTIDEQLWYGDLKDGWRFETPDVWPSDQKFDDDIDGAIECFKSIKRKFYFENERASELDVIQAPEIKFCNEIFNNYESEKSKIKRIIIRSINKLFLPSYNDDRKLHIWTTHHYDLSQDTSIAVSSHYIDFSQLDLLMPKPAAWLEQMEYVPNYIALKPNTNDNNVPKLILNVNFLRVLKLIDDGYPIELLSPMYEQSALSFMHQILNAGLYEKNGDGRIIIASRTSNLWQSLYIEDGKYEFDEERQ